MEEYLHSEDNPENGQQETPVKASMSAETLSTRIDPIDQRKEKEENAIMTALPWLRSLSKMSSYKDLSLKKSSLRRITKSLTSWDLQRLSVRSIEFFSAPNTPSPCSEAKFQDDTLVSESLLFVEELVATADAEPPLKGQLKLKRDSSWSKICRKFVRKQRRERERDASEKPCHLKGSLSVASGLFVLFQQDLNVDIDSDPLLVS